MKEVKICETLRFEDIMCSLKIEKRATNKEMPLKFRKDEEMYPLLYLVPPRGIQPDQEINFRTFDFQNHKVINL